MDKKLLKKHGINPERLQKKLETAAKNKTKKEAREKEEQLRKEALLNEMLEKYATSEDICHNKKVTYEDVVVKEYYELQDLLKTLELHLDKANLNEKDSAKIRSQIQLFSKMRDNLMETDETILIKHKLIKNSKVK